MTKPKTELEETEREFIIRLDAAVEESLKGRSMTPEARRNARNFISGHPLEWFTVEEVAASWGLTAGKVRKLLGRLEFFNKTFRYNGQQRGGTLKISADCIPMARKIVFAEMGMRKAKEDPVPFPPKKKK